MRAGAVGLALLALFGQRALAEETFVVVPSVLQQQVTEGSVLAPTSGRVLKKEADHAKDGEASYRDRPGR
jgi:hypothetical protein